MNAPRKRTIDRAHDRRLKANRPAYLNTPPAEETPTPPLAMAHHYTHADLTRQQRQANRLKTEHKGPMARAQYAAEAKQFTDEIAKRRCEADTAPQRIFDRYGNDGAQQIAEAILNRLMNPREAAIDQAHTG